MLISKHSNIIILIIFILIFILFNILWIIFDPLSGGFQFIFLLDGIFNLTIRLGIDAISFFYVFNSTVNTFMFIVFIYIQNYYK